MPIPHAPSAPNAARSGCARVPLLASRAVPLPPLRPLPPRPSVFCSFFAPPPPLLPLGAPARCRASVLVALRRPPAQRPPYVATRCQRRRRSRRSRCLLICVDRFWPYYRTSPPPSRPRWSGRSSRCRPRSRRPELTAAPRLVDGPPRGPARPVAPRLGGRPRLAAPPRRGDGPVHPGGGPPPHGSRSSRVVGSDLPGRAMLRGGVGRPSGMSLPAVLEMPGWVLAVPPHRRACGVGRPPLSSVRFRPVPRGGSPLPLVPVLCVLPRPSPVARSAVFLVRDWWFASDALSPVCGVGLRGRAMPMDLGGVARRSCASCRPLARSARPPCAVCRAGGWAASARARSAPTLASSSRVWWGLPHFSVPPPRLQARCALPRPRPVGRARLGLPWALPRGVACPPILLRAGALLLGSGPPRRAVASALSMVANVMRDVANLCGPLPIAPGPPAGGACMKCGCWWVPVAPSCPRCGCFSVLALPGQSAAQVVWLSQHRPCRSRWGGRWVVRACTAAGEGARSWGVRPGSPTASETAEGWGDWPESLADVPVGLGEPPPPRGRIWPVLCGTYWCAGCLCGGLAWRPCWRCRPWWRGACFLLCIAGCRTSTDTWGGGPRPASRPVLFLLARTSCVCG